MSLKQIREQYGVPAKRGARVVYTSSRGVLRGTIKSAAAHGMYIMVHLDGDPKNLRRCFHPTWNIEYLP
jgi:hypothetical protein